jgi:hypothetical protein
MKPKTQQAMKRAGITYQILGEALGKDHTYINRAIAQRLPPEQAGTFVRALGELTHLTTKERREIFREVVNWPGEAGRSVVRRISTEDPWAELNEATERLGPTNYEQAERDAKRLFGGKNNDS